MDYANHTSSEENDLTIELIVTVVEYLTNGDQPIKKKGFCSSFLTEIDIGSNVYFYIKSSGFHLPGTKRAQIQIRRTQIQKIKIQIYFCRAGRLEGREREMTGGRTRNAIRDT